VRRAVAAWVADPPPRGVSRSRDAPAVDAVHVLRRRDAARARRSRVGRSRRRGHSWRPRRPSPSLLGAARRVAARAPALHPRNAVARTSAVERHGAAAYGVFFFTLPPGPGRHRPATIDQHILMSALNYAEAPP